MWDTEYIIARNVTITVDAPDSYRVTASIYSPTYAEVGGEALDLLSRFATATTPRRVAAEVMAEHPFSEEEIRAVLAEMMQNQLLVPASQVVPAETPPAVAAVPNIPDAADEHLGEEYFAGYEGKAGPYSETSGRELAQQFLPAAARQVATLAGLRVVDLGCATGHSVAALREAGLAAFGVELSSWALAHAVPAARPFVFGMDATRLEVFPDDAFDFVIANMTPHIPPERMVSWLRSVARLAKVGVYIRYITPEYAERLIARRGGESARRLYCPWSAPMSWWDATFAAAGLRVLARDKDEDWDTWVMLK